jgi:hypothetical protein
MSPVEPLLPAMLLRSVPDAYLQFLPPTDLGRLAATDKLAQESTAIALDSHRSFLPPQTLWRLTAHGTPYMAGALCACAKPIRAIVQRILPTDYWSNTGLPLGWPQAWGPSQAIRPQGELHFFRKWVLPQIILRPRGKPPYLYTMNGFPRDDLATMVMPGNPAVWTPAMRRQWHIRRLHHSLVIQPCSDVWHRLYGRLHHSLESEFDIDTFMAVQYSRDQSVDRHREPNFYNED